MYRGLGLGTLGLGFDLWSACALVLKFRDAIIALIRVLEAPSTIEGGEFQFWMSNKLIIHLKIEFEIKFFLFFYFRYNRLIDPELGILNEEAETLMGTVYK